jgi:hypothetical protein
MCRFLSLELSNPRAGHDGPLCVGSRHAAPSPRIATAVALLVALLGGASVLAAQALADVTAEFDASVARYLAVRERLRSSITPEHIIDPNIREISGALLAARIQEARGEAAATDVFTPAMSERIREALRRSFDATEVDALLAASYPRGLPAPDAAQLSASYADTVAVRVSAAILAALPAIPLPELGYRLIGRDLVLWDEDAEIVVDIVAEALPAPRIWPFLDMSSLELRACVARALGDARLDGGALVDEMLDDTLDGATSPEVGEPFSWRLGNMMPPAVLHALPQLPAPLQYRFAAADLVVIDTRTNIVVGILSDALPAGGRATSRTVNRTPGRFLDQPGKTARHGHGHAMDRT